VELLQSLEFQHLYNSLIVKVSNVRRVAEDFIYQQEGSRREVMLYLHQLFLDMNLVAKIRYRVPFYYGKSWICYLNPQKKESIELAFRDEKIINATSSSDSYTAFAPRKICISM